MSVTNVYDMSGGNPHIREIANESGVDHLDANRENIHALEQALKASVILIQENHINHDTLRFFDFLGKLKKVSMLRYDQEQRYSKPLPAPRGRGDDF